MITRTRRRLQDPRYFDLTTPRCYLYSKSDTLIAWEDVQEHAHESQELAVPVTQVVFDHSAHVEHAKEEPERYWAAVMSTWESRVSVKEMSTKIRIIIGEVDCTEAVPDAAKKDCRWHNGDSQATLLPDSRLTGDEASK